MLLHGLGRSRRAMTILQLALARDGYAVWNKGYRSRRAPIEQLAAIVGDAIADCRSRGARKIHFVTHSLGGILVRQYFQDHDAPEAGRVVMIAPPNHGSAIVDAHRQRWWFKVATGPAGQQLGTGPDSVPNRLRPLTLEIGVIAGRRDGKVSVDSTRLAEMKQLCVVDSAHTFLMNSPRVIREVKAFLKNGAFDQVAPQA